MGKAAIAFKDIGKAASGSLREIAAPRAGGGGRGAEIARTHPLATPLLFPHLPDLLSKDFKVGQNKVEVKSKTSNGVVRGDPAARPPADPAM